MTSYKPLVFVFVLFLISLIFLDFSKKDDLKIANIPRVENIKYINLEHGIYFYYPNSYNLSENEFETPLGHKHEIALTDKNYLAPKNGEGPTEILIQMYENASDTPLDFVKKHKESNWGLGSREVKDINTGSGNGISYKWDGLYQGETAVFRHEKNIILISVTFDSLDDKIYADYKNLLTSLVLFDESKSIEEMNSYIKENISKLTSKTPVLGGKFFVTNIEYSNNSEAIVTFEDGHIEERGKFTFDIDSGGRAHIENFTDLK